MEGLGSELELESALAWAEAVARGPEQGPVLVLVQVQGHHLHLRPRLRPVLQEILAQVLKLGPMQAPMRVQDPEETGEVMEVVQDMVGDVAEVMEEEMAPVKDTVRATARVMVRGEGDMRREQGGISLIIPKGPLMTF